MSTAIQTHQLTKRYRRVSALTQCTVTVPEGRVSALVGPNGEGKPVTGLRHSSAVAPSPWPVDAGSVIDVDQTVVRSRNLVSDGREARLMVSTSPGAAVTVPAGIEDS